MTRSCPLHIRGGEPLRARADRGIGRCGLQCVARRLTGEGKGHVCPFDPFVGGGLAPLCQDMVSTGLKRNQFHRFGGSHSDEKVDFGHTNMVAGFRVNLSHTSVPVSSNRASTHVRNGPLEGPCHEAITSCAGSCCLRSRNCFPQGAAGGTTAFPTSTCGFSNGHRTSKLCCLRGNCGAERPHK